MRKQKASWSYIKLKSLEGTSKKIKEVEENIYKLCIW